MPASYPRTNNPYLHLSHSQIRRFQRALNALHDLSRSMGGKLIIQTWLNVSGDEAGWHQSKSTQRQNHLTIKKERDRNKKGKCKRKNVGHIFSDGSTEDFGSYPSLKWLTLEGKVPPGIDAIKTLEHLRKAGHRRLIKDVRRQLQARLSQNGISSEP